MINHPQHIELRDGTITTDPNLDRIVESDEENRTYRAVGAVVEADAPFRSKTWDLDTYLDQGKEGACVGFGCTHELIATPVGIKGLDAKFAREQVYWEAQKDDPWDGGSYPGATPVYEGTSVLSGVKVLQRLGYITEYRWAFSLDDMRRVVGNYGPMIIGVNWYSGMFNTDSNGFINATGYIAGGHCLLVVGVDEEGQFFWLHNSWNRDWGVGGRCKISFSDMAKLLAEDGDACVPVVRVDPNARKNFFRSNRSKVVHDTHAKVAQDVWYTSLEEALTDGCRPCRICKPKEL